MSVSVLKVKKKLLGIPLPAAGEIWYVSALELLTEHGADDEEVGWKMGLLESPVRTHGRIEFTVVDPKKGERWSTIIDQATDHRYDGAQTASPSPRPSLCERVIADELEDGYLWGICYARPEAATPTALFDALYFFVVKV